MSILDKLSIRGVRSFGTAQRDEQKITFSAPITLILGENGCGKTTIIECLKYALIGELPPGSSKGQSFVHDPKIFNVSESLGQVKLQVKNDAGDKITVCRSMKTSVAKGRAAAGGGLKFETLDSTIHVVLQGRHESVSKRCVDTNAEMAHVMGVPKAIINNVLFCHQEDSSWPLDEAKKLKERFDEIFGTTEYHKAIDKILKQRKAYEAKAKEKESELQLLEHLKKDAELRTVDLATADDKLQNLQLKMTRCEEAQLPIRERLDKIRSIELEITKLYTNKTEVATKLEKCKEHEASVSAKIRTPFTGTPAQLERELLSFDQRQATMLCELQRCTEQLTAANAAERRAQQLLAELDSRRATLLLQRQQEQELSDTRANHLRKLRQKLALDGDDDGDLQQATPAALEAALEQTRAAFAAADTHLAELGERHDREDAALQAELDGIRERRTAAESDVMAAKRQAAQLRQEMSQTQQKIDGVEKCAAQLKTVAGELVKVDRCVEDCQRDADVEGQRAKCAARQQRLEELQLQLDVLDVDVSVLSANAQLTTEIGLKRTAHEQREADVRRLRNKHADNLQQLLGGRAVDAQYKRHVQSRCTDLQRQISEGNRQIAGAKQRATELQMTRKAQRAELQRAERELTDTEERVYEQCASGEYEDVLGRAKASVAKLQLDHGALSASQVLYAKYEQKMASDPCCPLCHRDMSTAEVSDLSAEMHDEVARLPEKIVVAERALRTEQRKYETLLGLRPACERVAALHKDLPQQRQTLAASEKALAAATAEADDLQLALAEPQQQLEMAQSMLGDMSLLDEALREAGVLGEQLAALRARMPERPVADGGAEPLTLAEAQEQRATLSRTMRTERTELEGWQREQRAGEEQLQQLREKRNALKAQQIEMQEGVQALGAMRTRRTELDAQIERCTRDAAEHEAALAPLRASFAACTERKAAQRERNRAALAAEARGVSEARTVEREVLRCGAELRRLAGLQLQRELERVRAANDERLVDQQRAADETADLAGQQEKLREQLAGQELSERDLRDNRELLRLGEERQRLQTQLDGLLRDLGDHGDFASVTREKKDLVQQSDTHTMERSECLGQIGELRARAKQLRTELAAPKYRDAVRTYLQEYYAAVVLRRMVRDLGTYRVALEWALMSFHTEKMAKINLLVKGLWHKIYRGNDIDYIQIRTDEMKVQNVDKRRSYDYRVVQIKNDSELDMRGRCSAGQRVLACLIIRIALAETFSSNCGVLTLDEPTTNLDRVNIVSLCHALNAIVEERQAQSNFMLVVITHDEEFITTLGRIENYWKVSRGTTGKSLIEMVTVE